MSGEQPHAKGRDGALRAKRWLEGTTRAQVHWVNPDHPATNYLDFKWADDSNYSFDIGGVLEGGTHHGRMFLGESKNYAVAADQGTEFEKFLVKCYRVLAEQPGRGEIFLWVTWAAFWSTKWDTKTSPGRITAAVQNHREKCFGEPDKSLAASLIDQAVVAKLAESLWVLVLSPEQEEHLVLSREHLALVRSHMVMQGAF